MLLACRQWDPLGLARRLPSLEVKAWRSAPLLPWRVQCPVRVCAALAAGSGGSRRYLVLCLSRFPLPAPRVPRCVWRAVPFGCHFPSLAGTPFHAVCAFRELGPVALLVVPACSLRVCALALPRRLPPPLGGVACAPRAAPALGAGRAVPRGPCPSTLPAPVPCSVWRAWGGGAVRSWFPPTWLEAVRHQRAVGAGVWVWGPNTVPLACMPCGGCVPQGWWGAIPGGGVACHCCGGRLVSGAVPPPTTRPLGRAAGVPRPVCSGCGLCGRGGPAPVPQLALLRAGVARCEWRKGVPGGAAFHHRVRGV